MAEYTMPRSVMAEPPSPVTFPPRVAPVLVIEVAEGVVTVGTAALSVTMPKEDTAARRRDRRAGMEGRKRREGIIWAEND
jgi:hypothetical protein